MARDRVELGHRHIKDASIVFQLAKLSDRHVDVFDQLMEHSGLLCSGFASGGVQVDFLSTIGGARAKLETVKDVHVHIQSRFLVQPDERRPRHKPAARLPK